MKKVLFSVLLTFWGHAVLAQPTFTQQFNPDTIGVDGHAELNFIIQNNGPNATDLAFTNNLPAGVTLGEQSSNSCQGVLNATPGSSSIIFSGGVLVNGQSCQVTVSVTSDIAANHTNVSGDLTSSAGNSGTSTDDLTVRDDGLSFTMSAFPNSITYGNPSTLTFTLDNSTNNNFAFNPNFSISLPSGVFFDQPHGLNTDCQLTLSVDENSQTMSTEFTNAIVDAGTSCTIDVNVVGLTNNDVILNTTPLTYNSGSSFGINAGFAEELLQINAAEMLVHKSFIDDPTRVGGTVTLRYEMTSRNRDFDYTDLSFTDDFTALGLTVGSVVQNSCGLAVSGLGTTLLQTNNGTLPAQQSCVLEVSLSVSTLTTAGTFPSISSDFDYEVQGSPQSTPPAIANLVITDAPLLSMQFLTNPVATGDSTDIEYTITNTSTTNNATDITFDHQIVPFLSFPASATMPADGFCGAGSQAMLVSLGLEEQAIRITGANLLPSLSCTFAVTIDIPVDFPTGLNDTTTTPISATVAGNHQIGNQAAAQLDVIGAPQLSHDYVDDPTLPGDTVTVEYTLTLGAESAHDASAISFTHDLDAVVTGLTAVGLPVSDVCGVGSSLSGTSLLTLTGGSLAAGSQCSFSVTLQVPAASPLGTYDSTTSGVSATIAGLPTSNTASVAQLQLAAIEFDMELIPGTAFAGVQQAITIRHTITNLDPSNDLTNILFSNNLNNAISGWTTTSTDTSDVCGAGSQLTFSGSFYILSGGNLSPGEVCTFDFQSLLPASSTNGQYTSTTSNLSGNSNGNAAVFDPASADLTIVDALSFTQMFIDDPVAPGDTVTLSYTITNESPTDGIDSISFTDDFDATLTGLTAVTLPADGFCGAGSQITGTSVLTVTSGDLPPSGSCTFNVTLQVPGDAPLGNRPTNTSSTISGAMNGFAVSGPESSDELQIFSLQLSKSFAGPTAAGQLATLTFRIDNLDTVNPKSDISFTDDLGAMLSGAVSSGLPISGVCGNISQLSGSDFILFNLGELDAGASCQFDVMVQIPANANAGTYPNVTSEISVSGLTDGAPAVANLVVEPAPMFSKLFNPNTAFVNETVTLTFTIDNSANALNATQLDFTDNLPAGMTVATPANASTTCTGGTLTATEGSGIITYSGGSVSAGSICTIDVDVTSSTSGLNQNITSDLTSSNGNSGTAAASLPVSGLPVFSKSFAESEIFVDQVTSLTFLVDNSATNNNVTGLQFTDNLPAGLLVSTPANLINGCGGTANANGGTIDLTGGAVNANASCTISVDVVATNSGQLTNITSDLGTDGGTVNAATANIEVHDAPMINKAFNLTQVNEGDQVVMTFTINNPSNVLLTDIAFSDDLDAFISGATALNLPQNNFCGAASMMTGTNMIQISGVEIPALSSCQIMVTIQLPMGASGSFTNITSPISFQANGQSLFGTGGSSGSAPIEVRSLNVTPIPVNQWPWLMLLLIGTGIMAFRTHARQIHF